MRMPDDSHRQVVVGATGSGKTQAAVNALSYRSWDINPWYVLNFKEDELINEIPGAIHMDGCEMPKHEDPGIYVLHPAPDDYDGMEALFEHAWRRRNVGIFVDEAYMISKPGWYSKWYRRLLTQGRSLNCPLITCSQRAVWIDSFMFSEATFIQVFQLSSRKDQKNLNEWVEDVNPNSLPAYWSYWYDVPRKELAKLRPCPSRDAILERFEARMEKLKESVSMYVKPQETFL